MSLLKYKYPDTDFENIKEKDIIYFCRDALNYDYKYKSPRLSKEQIVLDKKKYENEILLLIKREFFKNSENWDWYKKDIDDNIILTYPIHNNSLMIVKFLLSLTSVNGQIYNIKEYNQDICNAICSGINLKSDEVIEYILKEEIHEDYVSTLIKKNYDMISRVSNDYKEKYNKKFDYLFNYKCNFEKVIELFVCDRENFLNIKLMLNDFLDNYPIEDELKRKHINQFLENELIQKNKNHPFLQERVLFLGRWCYANEKINHFNHVENVLENNKKVEKKLKI